MIKLKDPLASNSTKDILVEEDSNGCFICKSHAKGDGGRYYQIKRNGERMLLHRYVYETYNGEIPNGLIVRHKCDNDLCVNPHHLILGTHLENSKDMLERNREAKGESHGRCKLTNNQVSEVKKLLEIGVKQTVIAGRFGITQAMVSHIKRNVYRKDL